MYKLYISLLSFIVLSSFSWGGVAGNPFLRPGSNRPPPTISPPPPPPKPMIDPAFAKEVEFRGYFLLKGIPHFCIFNKKSNFGEWIKLSEKTYEEYKAQSFDLESETLTLAFNGQDFTLSLEQSKASPVSSPKASGLPKIKLPSSVSSSSSGNQKVMPAKPKSAPKLPDWLANRVSSRSSSNNRSSSSPSSFNSSTSSSSGIRSSTPSMMPFSRSRGTTSSTTGSVGNSIGSSIPPRVGGSSTPSTYQVPQLPSSSTSSSPPTSPGNSPDSSGGEVSGDEQNTDTGSNEQTDLEDLPPPPPPPNILPPSPPPDILPNLDE